MKYHKGIVIGCIILVVVFVLLALGCLFFKINREDNLKLSDFGIAPLVKSDCSSLKDVVSSASVSVSLSASKVGDMRDKVNALVTKYGGVVTSDSLNSYPTPPISPGGEKLTIVNNDSANITVTFDKGQAEFLVELSTLVKSTGAKNTGYTYSDGAPSYGSYSPYTTCTNYFETVSADMLQLSIFTQALKDEKSPRNIALMSQSISNTKTTLQNDVNTLNNFFAIGTKPTVNISISNY